MARSKRTIQRENKRRAAELGQQIELDLPIKSQRNTEPLKPKTETQKRYINAIKNFTLTFGVGPAGTGKSYIAAALAAQALDRGDIERIIITRPAIEAGESLGFLPGELEEKYEPYIAAIRNVLDERLGKSYVDYLLKAGRIVASPLAYMRGMTFRNAYVILDEAQNTTPSQMKLFLTRIGENCKVIIDGDPAQSDIKGPNGLEDAIQRISWIPSVKVIEFGIDDVVRSGIVAEILKSYYQTGDIRQR